MAKNPSAMKYKRQSDKRREKNRSLKSKIRTFSKKAVAAAEEGNAEAAHKYQRVATKIIDKAAKGAILHKNTAARKKSRLAKNIKNLALKTQS